jgi:hypothetical protein
LERGRHEDMHYSKWYDLVRPRRPELEAEMSVFNLAQKRSIPPLCIDSGSEVG